MTTFGNMQTPSKRLIGELKNNLWMIDKGCHTHVTSNLSVLTKVKDVQACLVGLLDGRTRGKHNRVLDLFSWNRNLNWNWRFL